jgi:hypothetical protein
MIMSAGSERKPPGRSPASIAISVLSGSTMTRDLVLASLNQELGDSAKSIFRRATSMLISQSEITESRS